jgi:DNA-binding transcriptional MerR regulator
MVMDKGRYLIEELCALSGFTRRTVRYYVQEGLVDAPAGRGRGGYYSDRHVAQLARIRGLQEQGYRLDAIRGLLGGSAPPEPPTAAPGRDAGTPRSSPASSWTRHAVAPGIELNVSAEAGATLGPAIEAALEAVRSIIEREGGLDG